MEARMRRCAPQTSPERNRVWTEPPPKHAPHQQQQGRTVPVVYYLCRNRHLEHPHFIEVALSSPQGLYLRDVIERLNVLRGRKMPAMYSWSCKRSYKNGFVWHDLAEDDLILPVQGNEYVLKGSELLDQSPTDRNKHGMSNPKNQKHPLQDPPPVCCNSQEASCNKSSVACVVKEPPKIASPSAVQPALAPPPPVREDEQSPPAQGSVFSSNLSSEDEGKPSPSTGDASPGDAECNACKPFENHDASTQTDGGGRTTSGSNVRVVGVSTDDGPWHPANDESIEDVDQDRRLKLEPEVIKVERSPPPTFSSAFFSSSSFRRMNTLESLIRDEASKRNNCEVVEEEVYFAGGPKIKATTNLLIHLITCGSTSVKDQYDLGFTPSYRPSLADKLTSPLFAHPIFQGEVNCLPKSQRGIAFGRKKKELISRSVMQKYKDILGEPKSSSLNMNGVPYIRRDEEKVAESAQCLPKTIKVPSCKALKNEEKENLKSSASYIMNTSGRAHMCGFSPQSSSYGGSKRILDSSSGTGSSRRLDSFREEKEKVIKIEERLTSGALVIIQSRARNEETEDSTDELRNL